jgi:ethanolamine ammonia-lyase large subunit
MLQCDAFRPASFSPDGNAMTYSHTIKAHRYVFADLRCLMARATPLRSGDLLAGLAAAHADERLAAQLALSDLPLRTFLHEAVVPYETDAVTRLILDTHDPAAFLPVAHLTVGDFRHWLLSDAATPDALSALAPGLTPEMVAAVSKICRLQDLVLIARKCRVVTRFRGTIGLPGRMATRLQTGLPANDSSGFGASVLDGLLQGSGDAVVGIHPGTSPVPEVVRLLHLLDGVIGRYGIPTQSCVLAHVTHTLAAMERGAPVDLVFQSIGGTEATNRSFGINLPMLAEAQDAALSLRRGALFHGADPTASTEAAERGEHVMYFETGQGSALSANVHRGCDQQTLEARAYGVARHFKPLLVNTVAGSAGADYLSDGKQIIRAGLEDHFCGKLLGVPMGCDMCHTRHAEADRDDMDALMALLGAAGCNFVMGMAGCWHDGPHDRQDHSQPGSMVLRDLLGLRPAPEFEAWLLKMGFFQSAGGGGYASLPRDRRRAAAPGPARLAA